MKNWNSPQKDMTRQIAILSTASKFRTALMLPSHSCLCLKAGLKSGTFDRETFILAVERDSSICQKIEKFLKDNFTNYIVYNGELHTLDLGKALKGKKLDFAFLDTCGTFSPQIVRWLRDNESHFEEQAKVSMTFCATFRSNGVFPETVWKNSSHLLPEVLDTLHTAKTNWFDNSIDTSYACNFNPVKDHNALVLTQILAMSFITRSFQITDSIVYNRGLHSAKMFFVSLNVKGQKTSPVPPALLSVLDQFTNKTRVNGHGFDIKSLYSQFDRFEDITPGKLAWITRTANENGKNPKRVASAIKAWFTMKK